MPKIQLNDISLHCKIRGQGPPMLMIMGLSANLDWWPEKLLLLLEKHYKLILFDNRGAGRTGGTKKSYRITQFAEDSIALLDALDIDEATVFGVSMGDMIGQEMALRHPKRVTRLILAFTTSGSKFRRHFSSIGLLHALLYSLRYPPNIDKLLLSLTLAQYKLKKPENHEFLRRISLAPSTRIDRWKQYFAVLRFNSYPRLTQISCPALVMTGTRDFLIPHINSDLIAKQIPNAKLIKFPKASHALVGDEPEAVFQAIQDFINA